jgi:carbonic anhydrase
MQRTLLVSTLLFFMGCESDDTDEPQPGDVHSDWSYEGEHGPEHWGDLPGNEQCSNGHIESPVALTRGAPASDLPDLLLDYQSSAVSILNSGHTLQYAYDPGSKLRIGAVEYDLLQFHFHAPSEHTLDGRQYPMEVHLVHKSADGRLAVLGVFIEEGANHEMLTDANWHALPQEAHETHEDSEALFNAAELIPGGDSFRYTGSLTTPPCTEGIAWHVFQTAITLSGEQIRAFTDLYANNYRPVQPVEPSMLAFGQ